MANQTEYDKKVERLKELIGAELDLCNSNETPYVCAEASDAKSRVNLVELILKMVLKGEGEMSVDDAIEQYERTFNPNMIN